MTVTINGTSGVSLCDTNSVPTAALQASAVTQPKVGAGVAGNGPAFFATAPGTQVVVSATQSVIQYTSKVFDTANCFDTSTYKFTPNVAGYYQLNFSICVTSTIVNGEVLAYIVKNGTGYLLFDFSGSNWWNSSGSILLYANGTTDWFRVEFYQGVGSSRTVSGGAATTFSGSLVRAA